MRPVIALLLGLSLFVGACDKRAAAPEQAAVTEDGTVPDVAAPADTGAPEAAAKVDRSHKGEAMPAYPFKDGTGKAVTLADFRGKPVLVNVWATWCAPSDCSDRWSSFRAFRERRRTVTDSTSSPGI